MSEKTQEKLLNELSNTIQELKQITEFGKRELKAISILSMNPFMRRFFTSNPDKNLDYIDNKKHLKRKFEKTLLKVNENLSSAIGTRELLNALSMNNQDNTLANLMKRL